MFDFTVVVPVYNGGDIWRQSIQSILGQDVAPQKVVVIDSSSTDDSASLAIDAGFCVKTIEKSDFDHGGTRSTALQFVDTEIVIFMTQDAILDSPSAFRRMLDIFQDKNISAAYGRQLPHYDANPLAKYARQNSYGPQGYVTSIEDDFPKGFRKAFMSNSFAAYRVRDLIELGTFPQKLILGEDSYFTAKALVAGKSVAYVADAEVRHSHNYSVREEFKRYFDIGVFHSDQSWMLEELGSVEGEGVKFALGQIAYLFRHKLYYYVFVSIAVSLAKYGGYRLGRIHKKLPEIWCKKMSMFKSYWEVV
ncbi:glycosyltransferase [Spongiibacter tropicus]|uniref:glycosyltransferase n=1 Tax=Spongiibacter tropicus TaxID=454602 RepID=UPI003009CE44